MPFFAILYFGTEGVDRGNRLFEALLVPEGALTKNGRKWQKRAKSGAQKIEKNTGKNDTGGVKEVENGELVVRAKRAFYI